MAALSYNLKKHLKCTPKKQAVMAIALTKVKDGIHCFLKSLHQSVFKPVAACQKIIFAHLT
ncbi:hypothetical protein DC498_21985 [Terrimonas sp.]|nr:hypothetical protein DC498_21985 [Terrimonas sp.]